MITLRVHICIFPFEPALQEHLTEKIPPLSVISALISTGVDVVPDIFKQNVITETVYDFLYLFVNSTF